MSTQAVGVLLIRAPCCHCSHSHQEQPQTGNKVLGVLQLVPMIDMVNHDVNAGGFDEVTGKEKNECGGVNLMHEDRGAFIIRSVRHGRKKAIEARTRVACKLQRFRLQSIGLVRITWFCPTQMNGELAKGWGSSQEASDVCERFVIYFIVNVLTEKSKENKRTNGIYIFNIQ